jgi:hypothetical protein
MRRLHRLAVNGRLVVPAFRTPEGLGRFGDWQSNGLPRDRLLLAALYVETKAAFIPRYLPIRQVFNKFGAIKLNRGKNPEGTWSLP